MNLCCYRGNSVLVQFMVSTSDTSSYNPFLAVVGINGKEIFASISIYGRVKAMNTRAKKKQKTVHIRSKNSIKAEEEKLKNDNYQ